MAVLSDVLNAVVDLAQTANPYATIEIGSLPAENGLCMAIAAGSASSIMLDKGMAYQLTCVLNGKHENQKTVLDALSDIHDVLNFAAGYPASDRYQITSISTLGAPNYLGREDHDQWLYGSSMIVKFYYRR